MSATLTWANGGLATKSGTTANAALADLAALVASYAGNADFSWEVAGSDFVSDPCYLVLRRKNGSAGRILLVAYASAPAGDNPTLFDISPNLDSIYGAWFPAGNTNTPLNLSASSGTILGSDTGATKAWAAIPISAAYITGYQLFYFDSAEGMLFGLQDPTATTLYGGGAGDLIVDAADVAYGCVFSCGSSTLTPGSGSAFMPWQSPPPDAGSGSAVLRTNYGSPDRCYFSAYTPAAWAQQAIGPGDVLSDTATQQVWFVAIPLVGNEKGEGMVLKLRQIGIGPNGTGAFDTYNTTGPVVAARRFSAYTSGGSGFAWVTNFKI